MENLLEPLKTRHLDQFRADLRGVCGSFDIANGRETLRGRVSMTTKGGLDLAYVGQNSKSINRTRRNITEDPGDHFFLVIQARGIARMQQNETNTELRKGDMFIVDSTQPSSFYFGEQTSHQLSLHLPRQETIQRFGAHINGGMKICRTDPLGQAMLAIVTEIASDRTNHQMQVAEAFYSVFGAYLYSRNIGEDGTLSPDRQIVNRALSVITQYFSDPDLDPSQIADLTGVSLRRLQRSFAAIETTPHKRLQDVRLKAVCEKLEQHKGTHSAQIAAIVFDCGFTDLSTFYRLFKGRYHCAPTVWRGLQ